ncbi:MAG: ABC transporter substrate-binding protein [Ktedonobacteraceae bacterium]|nr:ABC transporter substrate-binding protein [Ktedonobacteraceae bacterium]
MSTRHRLSLILPVVSLLTLLSLLLAACGGTTAGSGATTAGTAGTLKKVSIGLGYLPDIQFSPFYVAKSKGYYKDAGLDVTFNHGIVPDLVGSMAAGQNTFVFVSGDELLVARSKNVKAIDVATIFQKYPVSLIVPADSPIKTLSDLKGHTIGEPGPYGATHTGLLALLYKANLTLQDIKPQYINFTQVQALLNHKVDAVMGYSNNEPLQLAKRGMQVRIFAVSDYIPLVSNGIVTTEDTYHNQQQMVRAFVQATLKGVKDVIADPNAAVETSKAFVPNLNQAQALEVLKATIPIWQGNGQPGHNDDAAWAATQQFLLAQKMISSGQDVKLAYTNQLLS